MFCPNCGTKILDDALFCGSCGTKIEDAAVPTTDASFTYESVQQDAAPQTNETTQAGEYTQPQANETAQTGEYTQPQTSEATQSGDYVQPSDASQQQTYQQQYQQMGAAPQGQGYQSMGDATQGQYQQQYYSQPAYTAPKPPKQPIKITPLMIVTPILAVAFIVSIFVFSLVGKNTFSEDSVKADYKKALRNNDWAVAYEMLDITESEFINKDLFVKALSDTSGDDSLREQDVKSVEGSDKNFLFFKSYKIDPTTYIATDFTVNVVKGATLYMDGEEVSSSYQNDGDDYSTQYTIPRLFKGSHTFSIEVSGFESTTYSYNVSYDYDYYSITSIVLSEDDQKEIIETAYDYVQQIIIAANNGQSSDAITGLFADDAQRDAADMYDDSFADEFYAYTKDDGITEVSLTRVTGSVDSYYLEDGALTVDVSFKVDNTNKGYDKDWWTDELKEGTDESKSDNISVDLVYQDGKWLLEDDYSFPFAVSYNSYFY